MENLETRTVEDIWQRSMYMRSKMLNGLEVLMNVDISGSNATEKELIYERDKMKLYHYTPRVENPFFHAQEVGNLSRIVQVIN